MADDGRNRQIQQLLDMMQKTLECSICLEMLTNPVSTSCGHQFCRFCLLGCLGKKRQVPCPLCKKPVTKRSLMERSHLGEMVDNVRSLITGFQTDTGILFSPPRGPQTASILPGTPDSLQNHTSATSAAKRRLTVAATRSERRNVRQTRSSRVGSKVTESISSSVSSPGTGTANSDSGKQNIQTATENKLPEADNSCNKLLQNSRSGSKLIVNDCADISSHDQQLLHFIETGNHSLMKSRGRTRNASVSKTKMTDSGQDISCDNPSKGNIDSRVKMLIDRRNKRDSKCTVGNDFTASKDEHISADLDASATKTKSTAAGQPKDTHDNYIVKHVDNIVNGADYEVRNIVKDDNNINDTCTRKETDSTTSKRQINSLRDGKPAKCTSKNIVKIVETTGEQLAKYVEGCTNSGHDGHEDRKVTEVDNMNTCEDSIEQVDDNFHDDYCDSTTSEHTGIVQSGKTESDNCSLFKTPPCMKKVTSDKKRESEIMVTGKMALRSRIKTKQMDDKCDKDIEVTLTPDTVTESVNSVPFNSQPIVPTTGKTYSKKDKTIHEKESKVNRKVAEWLKSINQKDDDDVIDIVEPFKAEVKSKRSSKRVLKVQKEEQAMGQRLKSFAKQHSKNMLKEDTLFGFEDNDHSPIEIDEKDNKHVESDKCVNMNNTVNSSDNKNINHVNQVGLGEECDIEMLDETGVDEDDANVNDIKMKNGIYSVQNEKLSVLTASDTNVDCLTEATEIEHKVESEVKSVTDTSVEKGTNLDTGIPVRKRKIFKTRGKVAPTISPNVEADNHGTEHKAEVGNNVGNRTAGDKEKIVTKSDIPEVCPVKPRLLVKLDMNDSPGSDPYEFKSSQRTPQKPKKKKRQAKKSKTIKECKNERKTVCKIKNIDNYSIENGVTIIEDLCVTLVSSTDAGKLKSAMKSNNVTGSNVTTNNINNCDAVKNGKNGSTKVKHEVNSTLDEISRMAAKLMQAEDHDLLTCTQEALESIQNEKNVQDTKDDIDVTQSRLHDNSTVTQKRVRFQEPVISDFMSPGKIDIMSYRKAKAERPRQSQKTNKIDTQLPNKHKTLESPNTEYCVNNRPVNTTRAESSTTDNLSLSEDGSKTVDAAASEEYVASVSPEKEATNSVQYVHIKDLDDDVHNDSDDSMDNETEKLIVRHDPDEELESSGTDDLDINPEVEQFEHPDLSIQTPDIIEILTQENSITNTPPLVKQDTGLKAVEVIEETPIIFTGPKFKAPYTNKTVEETEVKMLHPCKNVKISQEESISKTNQNFKSPRQKMGLSDCSIDANISKTPDILSIPEVEQNNTKESTLKDTSENVMIVAETPIVELKCSFEVKVDNAGTYESDVTTKIESNAPSVKEEHGRSVITQSFTDGSSTQTPSFDSESVILKHEVVDSQPLHTNNDDTMEDIAVTIEEINGFQAAAESGSCSTQNSISLLNDGVIPKVSEKANDHWVGNTNGEKLQDKLTCEIEVKDKSKVSVQVTSKNNGSQIKRKRRSFMLEDSCDDSSTDITPNSDVTVIEKYENNKQSRKRKRLNTSPWKKGENNHDNDLKASASNSFTNSDINVQYLDSEIQLMSYRDSKVFNQTVPHAVVVVDENSASKNYFHNHEAMETLSQEVGQESLDIKTGSYDHTTEDLGTIPDSMRSSAGMLQSEMATPYSACEHDRLGTVQAITSVSQINLDPVFHNTEVCKRNPSDDCLVPQSEDILDEEVTIDVNKVKVHEVVSKQCNHSNAAAEKGESEVSYIPDSISKTVCSLSDRDNEIHKEDNTYETVQHSQNNNACKLSQKSIQMLENKPCKDSKKNNTVNPNIRDKKNHSAREDCLKSPLSGALTFSPRENSSKTGTPEDIFVGESEMPTIENSPDGDNSSDGDTLKREFLSDSDEELDEMTLQDKDDYYMDKNNVEDNMNAADLHDDKQELSTDVYNDSSRKIYNSVESKDLHEKHDTIVADRKSVSENKTSIESVKSDLVMVVEDDNESESDQSQDFVKRTQKHGRKGARGFSRKIQKDKSPCVSISPRPKEIHKSPIVKFNSTHKTKSLQSIANDFLTVNKKSCGPVKTSPLLSLKSPSHSPLSNLDKVIETNVDDDSDDSDLPDLYSISHVKTTDRKGIHQVHKSPTSVRQSSKADKLQSSCSIHAKDGGESSKNSHSQADVDTSMNYSAIPDSMQESSNGGKVPAGPINDVESNNYEDESTQDDIESSGSQASECTPSDNTYTSTTSDFVLLSEDELNHDNEDDANTEVNDKHGISDTHSTIILAAKNSSKNSTKYLDQSDESDNSDLEEQLAKVRNMINSSQTIQCSNATIKHQGDSKDNWKQLTNQKTEHEISYINKHRNNTTTGTNVVTTENSNIAIVELQGSPLENDFSIEDDDHSECEQNEMDNVSDDDVIVNNGHRGERIVTSSPVPDTDKNLASEKSDPVVLESDIENSTDEEPVQKRRKRKAVIADSSSDEEDDSSRHMNMTSSSAFSSQSENVTTQERAQLESDLERMAREMETIKAQLSASRTPRIKTTAHDENHRPQRKQSQNGSQRRHLFAISDSDGGDIEVDNSDDSDHDLFMTPPPLDLNQFSQTRSRSPVYLQTMSQSSRPRSPPDLHTQSSPTEVKVSQDDDQTVPPETFDLDMETTEAEPAEVKCEGGRIPLAELTLNSTQPKVVGRGRRAFLATGLNHTQVQKARKLASLIDCKFCNKFNDMVTHVIVKPAEEDDRLCDRTLKLFQGIAARCWVVNYYWVEDSLEVGHVLQEGPYEIQGDTTNGDLHEGPRRSRLASDSLFRNFNFLLIGDNENMTAGDMTSLVKTCGGQLIHHPSQLREHGRTALVVTCTDVEDGGDDRQVPKANSIYNKYGVLTVSREWVLDSLTRYSLQPLTEYILTSVRNMVVPDV